MQDYPKPLQRLIKELGKLPGVGPRSAQRMAFFLLGRPRHDSEQFTRTLAEALDTTAACRTCGGLAGAQECAICASPDRAHEKLCVVEEARDVFALEKAKAWDGVYHVLGGALSPLEGIGPEHLRVDQLVDRVRAGQFREIVLATDVDPEGETTAALVADALRPLGVPLTRLALGLPTGAQLEFGDPTTLAAAFSGRRSL